MDSNNYVAPYGSGYIVVVNGQQVGEYSDLTQAQNAYNDARGYPNAPAPTQSPAYVPPAPSGMPNMNVAPTQLLDMGMQAQLQAIHQAYLDERMRLLEIPEMQMRSAAERHRLALEGTLDLARLTGWINPNDVNTIIQAAQDLDNWGQQVTGLAQYSTANGNLTVDQMRQELYNASGQMQEWLNAPDDRVISEYGKVTGTPVSPVSGTTTAASYNTVNGTRSVSQMRQELYNASGGMQEWLQAPDQQVISEYGKVTGTPVTPMQTTQTAAQGILPGEPAPGGADQLSGFTPLPQEGQVPTMEGSMQFQQARSLADNLAMLGLDVNTLPAYQQRLAAGQQPTLALQELFRGAGNVPASLMALGMTPQQAGQTLQQTPLMQYLSNGGTNLMPNENPNSPFNFVRGTALPVRETLSAISQNNPLIKLYSGLAEFGGQDPEHFWGQFTAALPKGGSNPLTRFV